MRRGSDVIRVLVGSGIVWATTAFAQTPAIMSLAQAQQTALQNHPRIASAALTADASRAAVNEVRSAYYPTLSGNVTGAGAEHSSTLSAGFLTTSSMYSRGAT